ncbi:MAG: prepilin-type N-terminal cleavage/methylation domain-containing protein [Syntrophus sp. (in: bacteria)]
MSILSFRACGRGKSDFRGFTLMEVMIAMAILAITLVTVYQSQSQSISMASNARFLTTASLLAQSKMADIEWMNVKDRRAEGGSFGETFPDYRWRIEVTDTEVAYLKKIEVVVTNEKMAKDNTYRLVLYKAVSG